MSDKLKQVLTLLNKHRGHYIQKFNEIELENIGLYNVMVTMTLGELTEIIRYLRQAQRTEEWVDRIKQRKIESIKDELKEKQ